MNQKENKEQLSVQMPSLENIACLTSLLNKLRGKNKGVMLTPFMKTKHFRAIHYCQ